MRCCQGAFAQHRLLWGRFLERKKKQEKKDYKGCCLALTGNWLPYGREKSHFKSSCFLRGKEHSLFWFVTKKKIKQNWQNDFGDCVFAVCLSHHILAGPSHVRLSNILLHLQRHPPVGTEKQPRKTNPAFDHYTEHQVTGREQISFLLARDNINFLHQPLGAQTLSVTGSWSQKSLTNGILDSNEVSEIYK